MTPNKQKPEAIIGVVITIGMVIIILIVMPMTIIDTMNSIEPPPTKACNCIVPNTFLSLIGIGLLMTIILTAIHYKTLKPNEPKVVPDLVKPAEQKHAYIQGVGNIDITPAQ